MASVFARNFCTRCCTFLTFLLFPITLVLEARAPLSLARVLELASRHPALESYELARREATIRVKGAGLLDPGEIELELENVGGFLPGFRRAETTLLYTRPFVDRVLGKAKRELAGEEVADAGLEKELRAREISSAAQAMFHEIVLGRDRLALVGEEAERLLNLLAITRDRVEAGSLPENEILKATLELNLARLEILRRTTDLELKKASLSRILGLEALPGDDIVGTLDPWPLLPPHSTLLTALKRHHPAWLRLERSRARLVARLNLVAAESRSRVSWGAGLKDQREEGSQSFVVGVGIEAPGRAAGCFEKRALRFGLERIAAQEKLINTDLSSELALLVKSYEANQELAIRLRDIMIPEAHRLHELTIETFRLGRIGQLPALEAGRSCLESRGRLQDALGDLYHTLNTLEQLTGLCLVGEDHSSRGNHE